jgi:integrase
MANINFYLKTGKPNLNGKKSIILRVTFGQYRSTIFINKRVQPKHWSSTRQLVRPPKQREPDNNYENINETIRIFRDKAEEAIRYAQKNKLKFSDAYFKNYFGDKYVKPQDKSFFEWFDDYIESNRPNRAAWTIKGYETVKHFLEEFEKKTKTMIDTNAIDMVFFDSLKNFAFTKKKINDNYFAKIINVLKSMINWAKDRGMEISDHYNKFKASEREKEIIFLTIDELFKLYNHQFQNKRHEKARDIYCFGCFTGLRISDIISLQKEHIRDGKIHKTIKKTKRLETIPINHFAQEILDKYEDLEDSALPQISNQKLNEYIKECCKILEFNELISITRHSGSKTKEITFPKYKLITTHTARKTFLTNSIIMGMNYMAARGISGHKKEKDFDRYVKIAEDFKQKEMERTWDNLEK